MQSIISVRDVSKVYSISHVAVRYYTLREAFTEALVSILDALRGRRRANQGKEQFWALDKVSFEVAEGEVLGIIGRNGAGKSTLLKTISRITTPTTGTITLSGRVGSLLEVGTGFHPELTGRENIYLNGAVLGMRREEIKSKFDEIVAFAEVEKFLDTQVKHYSSGMYMRLAFAVAAHLEPEILIVDEVLAVGDSQFQKKCMGKMEDISQSGRTILFVSHNMAAIQNLCSRALLLDKGRVVFDGQTKDAVKAYMATWDGGSTDLDRIQHHGDGRARITSVWLENDRGARRTVVQSGDDVVVKVALNVIAQNLPNVSLAIGINAFAGDNLLHFWTETSGFNIGQISGMSVISCAIKRFPLVGGSYTISLFLTSSGQIVDWIKEGVRLDVEHGDFFQTGKLPPAGHSSVLCPCTWALE